MGKGRQEGGLAGDTSTTRIPSVTSSMGSGTLFGLDLPQPKDEQGLRETLCERRSVRVRCDESPYGKTFGSHLKPFHTVSVGNLASGNKHYRLWRDTGKANKGRSTQMSRRPSISDFLTNLEQPMPLGEKLTKLTRNLWRRVVLRQNCCGNHGEPGC